MYYFEPAAYNNNNLTSEYLKNIWIKNLVIFPCTWIGESSKLKNGFNDEKFVFCFENFREM